MRLDTVMGGAEAPAFPTNLNMPDLNGSLHIVPGLFSLMGQFVADFWQVVTDNMLSLLAFLFLWLCFEFGWDVYKWVKGGMGKWPNDDGQGRLF